MSLLGKLIASNHFILFRMQDEDFRAAPKHNSCGNDRIEIDFYRFKASQYAVDGKIDDGSGDTLFSQLFRGMKRRSPEKWKEWWRKDNLGDRVFRANFKGENAIDASGPYREVMENVSAELCSSVLPVLIPTEN